MKYKVGDIVRFAWRAEPKNGIIYYSPSSTAYYYYIRNCEGNNYFIDKAIWK